MTIVSVETMDLTPYGKLAFGHLPTWLGKPAAGFPQLHSLDDDGVYFFSDSGLTLYRGTSGGHQHFTVRGRSSETAIQSELSENSKLKTENC